MTLDLMRSGHSPRKRGYVVPAPQQAGWSAAPSRRRSLVSWAALGGILFIQLCLSLRLQNTISVDEAILLNAGHNQINGIPHVGDGLSGAPQLYPAIAARLNDIGGLTLVRTLSMLFMMGSTALLYSFTRRLFNERAGLAGAALYVCTQSTQILGRLATFDALAIFLLAFSIWLLVKTSRNNVWAGLGAIPVFAIAIAVKYATALYLLPVAALALLVVIPHHGFQVALTRAAAFFGGVIGGSLVLLAATGSLGAFLDTSSGTGRAKGTVFEILGTSIEWGGLVMALGVLGAVLWVRRARMGEVSGPAATEDPDKQWRIWMAVALCAPSLLAPLYQGMLQTGVSLSKHIGLGMLFTAVIAGVGINRVMGAHFKFPQLGIMLGVIVMVFGMAQASYNYGAWPKSKGLMATFEKYHTPKGRYLTDAPQIPVYYLRDKINPNQFTGIDRFTYTPSKKTALTGAAAYEAAIKDAYFDVIAIDEMSEGPNKKAILDVLNASTTLYLKGAVPYQGSHGTSEYDIWLKKIKP